MRRAWGPQIIIGRATALLGVLLVAVWAPAARASLKHPVHGRNQYSRPVDVKDSMYHQLDNTDFFKDNVEPVTYRKSLAQKKKEQEQQQQQSGQKVNSGAKDTLGDIFGTWDNVNDAQSAGSPQMNDSAVGRNLMLNDWLTWEEAADDGELGPLRITYVTEFWDQGEQQLEATEHCAREGQFVRPSEMTATTVGGSGSIVCTEDDIVTNVTVGIVNLRLDWVKEYVAETFTVKQVQPGEGVTINSNAQENYPFSQTTFTDTDLVIVVTLHPISAGGIAGYAFCAQYDQFGRCTVGYFNWVPDGLSVASTFYYPNVAMAERSTALHEVLHVVGCCKDTNLFRHPDDGSPFADEEKWIVESESTFIDKQITKWITPGVLAAAREQFNCTSITGVPLEDVPLGQNAHWEARLLGPDVMSYGIGSGESYVSSLTLKFFNDTNQYIVNMTAGAQRIYPASGDDHDLALSAFADIFASTESGDAVMLQERTWSPGYLRWGRNAGCPFVQQPPGPENWGDRYFCTSNNKRQCTGDRRMSAACYLLEYSSAANDAGDVYYTRSDTSPSDTSEVANVNAPYLPNEYQYLVEFDLANWGGYSSSMDFAPVAYGIWNCQDQEPSLDDVIAMEGVEFVDAGDLFSSTASDVAQFGGQVFSAHSRCFDSSLLQYTEVQYLTADFQSFGLCYLSNCYTDNYLQIGLKTSLGGIKWFRCQEAGDVYVSGFIGTFTCPDPADFCAYEDVSGVKYTENNETLEWIFWGVLLGLILILFIVFCCCRKVRQCVALKLKQMMNFDLTHKYLPKEHRSPGFWVLTIICVIWDIVGAALIVIGVIAIIDTTGELLWETASRQVYHFIGLGIFIVILSSLGTMSAKADHPTLKAAIYFYSVLFLLIAAVFLAIIVFAVPAWLQVIVELTWDTLHAQFPDSWQLYTAQQAWDEMMVIFNENSAYIYLGVGWSALSMLSGLVITFIMLEFKNVIGTMLFWMNVVILVAGIIFIWACSALAEVLPQATLVGLLVPGCIIVIVGIVGVATCRNTDVLVAYLIVTGLGFIAMLAAGIWLLGSVEENSAIVNNLTVSQLGDLVQKLEFFASEWTEAEIRAWLDANLQAAGIAAIILSFVVLGTIGAAVIVLRSSQVIKKKLELEQASKRMDVSGAREWEHSASTGFSSTEESGLEMGEIRFAEPVEEVRYAEDNEYVSRSGGRV